MWVCRPMSSYSDLMLTHLPSIYCRFDDPAGGNDAAPTISVIGNVAIGDPGATARGTVRGDAV